MRRLRGPWPFVVAWCALIFILSSVPGRDLPEMPAENADKVVHAAVYGVLGALLFWAARRSWSVRAPLAILLSVILATIYGVSDELHQLLTPGRSSDVHDVMADAVGAIAGALVACAAFRRARGGPPVAGADRDGVRG